MATVTLKVEGLSEAINRLQRVSRAYAANRIRPLLLKGAELFEESVSSEAPRRTGDLQDAIQAKLARRTDDIAAYTAVDFSRLNAKTDARGRKYRYPYMVESGAGSHLIRPRNGKVLRFGSTVRGLQGQGIGTAARYARSVRHPGFAANPYFSRGFKLAKNAVQDRLERDLIALLAREVA